MVTHDLYFGNQTSGAVRTKGGIGHPIASAIARISSDSREEITPSMRTLRVQASMSCRFTVGLDCSNCVSAASIASRPHSSPDLCGMVNPVEVFNSVTADWKAFRDCSELSGWPRSPRVESRTPASSVSRRRELNLIRGSRLRPNDVSRWRVTT